MTETSSLGSGSVDCHGMQIVSTASCDMVTETSCGSDPSNVNGILTFSYDDQETWQKCKVIIIIVVVIKLTIKVLTN